MRTILGNRAVTGRRAAKPAVRPKVNSSPSFEEFRDVRHPSNPNIVVYKILMGSEVYFQVGIDGRMTNETFIEFDDAIEAAWEILPPPPSGADVKGH
jgi:hypothetical protein